MAREAIPRWIEDMIERGADVPIKREPSRIAIVTVHAPFVTHAGRAQG